MRAYIDTLHFESPLKEVHVLLQRLNQKGVQRPSPLPPPQASYDLLIRIKALTKVSSAVHLTYETISSFYKVLEPRLYHFAQFTTRKKTTNEFEFYGFELSFSPPHRTYCGLDSENASIGVISFTNTIQEIKNKSVVSNAWRKREF